jgi:hypothetical protein
MKLKALALLKIAQQIGEEPTLDTIDAHVKLVCAGRRCDGIGSGLVLAHGVKSQERNELARLEIELFQLLYREFKMETSGGFR